MSKNNQKQQSNNTRDYNIIQNPYYTNTYDRQDNIKSLQYDNRASNKFSQPE
jgi:hypothetical protein